MGVLREQLGGCDDGCCLGGSDRPDRVVPHTIRHRIDPEDLDVAGAWVPGISLYRPRYLDDRILIETDAIGLRQQLASADDDPGLADSDSPPSVLQQLQRCADPVPFRTYFENTLLVTVLSVAGSVLSSSLVAYSFARLRWPGRDMFFVLVLVTMLLPSIVTFIPQYVLFSKIHWVGTFLPLIVPTWFGNAFYIFLLRQFFRGIPQELSEAARLDGASEIRIWWQIVMPLARPALAAVGIFSFAGAWEDYFNPLVYVGGDPSKWTLQLGLKAFESAAGGGSPLWNLIMAAGLVVMIPVLIAFFVGQKYFIEGVTLTGLKG